MDLNKVRLLEACLAYLVDKTSDSVKQNLEKSALVFEYDKKLYQFTTYQDKPYRIAFAEYKLSPFELRQHQREVGDVYDLYQSLSLDRDELSVLARIDDVAIVKTLIFKLLTTADLATLSESYADLKENRFVYNLYDLELNKTFPVYQFPEDASFRLVSIT